MVDPRKVAAEALSLSRVERTAIAVELLESLDGDPETDPEQAWDAEIRVRVEDVRDGRIEGDPLEDAIAELDELVSR